MEWHSRPVRERIKITEFFTFFKKCFTSDYHFLGEAHNFWEFLYVIKGSVCVSADDKVYNLTEGSIIFHKPLEFHKFHVIDDKGAELLIASYSAEGELTEFLQNKVFSLDDNQKIIVSQLMSYVSKYGKRIKGSLESYIGLFEEAAEYSQYVCLYLYRLFLSLAESDSIIPVSGDADSVVFAKTVKYMNAMACQMIAVEDFASYANVSASKLKRIFLRYAGVGIHKYFMMIKLKMATELLNEGLSVTDVAEKMGFSSQSYFTTVFKRENGYLPSEIGKSIRESSVYFKQFFGV